MIEKRHSLGLLFLAMLLAGGNTAFSQVRPSAESKVLSFKYRKGDTYRILSLVHEDVYLNRRLVNHAEIVNRISVEVLDAHSDGSGTLDGTFMTSEDSTAGRPGASFTFGEEFKSRFDRSKTGRYTISDEYFMPVVRDDPIFPETPVKSGDTWEADGYEAEDFRKAFGMEKPFKVPFTAKYKYLGVADGENGQVFDVIEVKYDFRYESPKPKASKTFADLMSYPAVTAGYSHETLYWDNDAGEIDHYNEDFKIEIETFYGDRYVFQGTAEAKMLQVEKTNTSEEIEKVQGALDDLALENVTVKRGEKGLTISIERIQFLPDSSELQESEKAKIKKIASLLSQYNNDLLVTGHCANRGSLAARQRISEERAKSVAGYLIELGARDAHHVFTQGKGAADPVATNDTEEGRAQNRRVEITLMDK